MLVELLIGLSLTASAATPVYLYQRSAIGTARRRTRRAKRRVERTAKKIDRRIQKAENQLPTAAKKFVKARRLEKLRSTPVESLKQQGVRNVRWSALRDANVNSLVDLTRHSTRSLQNIRGVGPVTAHAVMQAGQQRIRQISKENVGLPKPDEWSRAGTEEFARAAWPVLRAHQHLRGTVAHLRAEGKELEEVWKHVRQETGFLDWALQRRNDAEILDLEAQADTAEERVDELDAKGLLDRKEIEAVLSPPTEAALHKDFEAQYADYAAAMESALHKADGKGRSKRPPELAVGGPQRGLPAEIANRIERHPLRAEDMRVVLRGYQEFGTKYLLAQKRTVLGDEMGLGKTIQALAAMIHLEKQEGSRHFLVVCPASIMENWLREITRRTDLRPVLLHGQQRRRALASWVAEGGLGVTSYGTLSALQLPSVAKKSATRPALTIIDEAHYAKNPGAKRSMAVRDLAAISERICLMTGTPLENRLDEFKNIVRLASREVAASIPEEGFHGTRVYRIVAPVYLRRNQVDVLTELPEKISKDEWCRLTSSDRAAYENAVREQHYMGMRKAATIGAGHGRSAKIDRLAQLLDEYREEGRKVLVFSFFLDVLRLVAERFSAIGTLQGSVPPRARLELIDKFQAEPGHALLVSQIEAGGVGVNLQAASVVVLMEPQWKPSTEAQAIARAHRMGQTEHVIVHRMLASDCVDERMVELLREKQAIFDTHVQRSALKEASAKATEKSFAKRVIEEELAKIDEAGPSAGPTSSRQMSPRK